MYVFVYGTLKRGFGNHYLLNKQPEATIIAELPFQMISLGGFPGLIKSETTHQITGEIYHIDKNTLRELDRLEGYPDFYTRGEFSLKEFGIDSDCMFYYLNTSEEYSRNRKVVESGNWSN